MEQFVSFVINNWMLWLALIVILALLVSDSFGMGEGKDILTPQATVKLMNSEKVLILDMRDAAMYAQGHIIGARNHTISDIEANIKKYQKHKDTPIILYCNAGQQAAKELKPLRKLGFNQVHTIKGGLQAWKEANLPLEKGKGGK